MVLVLVKLHMVFAGRGDSFILEVRDGQGDRYLVLIDGGPAGHRHGKAGAPYTRYFMAAIRRIWDDVEVVGNNHTDTVTIGHVINSHPDDDHYKGLLETMSINLGRGDFHLAGSFFTPYWPDDDSYGEIHRLLTVGKGFSATAATQNSFANTDYIRIHFPEQRHIAGIVEFVSPKSNRYTPALNPVNALRQLLQPDRVRDKNDSSILMSIEQDPQIAKKAIFFTGDGEARRIHNYVTEFNQDQPRLGNNYSVYKIPHHGSQEHQDSAWDTVNIGIPPEVYHEYVLYYLAFSGPGSSLPLWHRHITYRTQTVANMQKYLGDMILSSAQGASYWKNLLQVRHHTYVQQIVTSGDKAPTLTFIPDASMTDFINEYLANMTSEWDQVHNILIPTPKMVYYKISDLETLVFRGNHYVREMSSWYVSYFYNTTGDMFSWVNRYAKICRFFSSFTADSYVVSGSSTVHGHPTVAVITGLALAMRQQQRQANLYMTDAGMVYGEAIWKGAKGNNWPNVSAAAEMLGLTPEDLFDRGNLSLRYLSNDYYLTIDANINLQHPQSFNREIRNVTSTISNFTNAEAQRQVYDHLKETATVLNVGNAGALDVKIWRFQTILNSGKRRYVGLKSQGRHVQILCGSKPADLYAEEVPGGQILGSNGWNDQRGFTITLCLNNQFAVGETFTIFLHKFKVKKQTQWKINYHSKDGDKLGFFQLEDKIVNRELQPRNKRAKELTFTIYQSPRNVHALATDSYIPIPMHTTLIPVDPEDDEDLLHVKQGGEGLVLNESSDDSSMNPVQLHSMGEAEPRRELPQAADESSMAYLAPATSIATGAVPTHSTTTQMSHDRVEATALSLRDYFVLAGADAKLLQGVSIARLFAYCLEDEIKAAQLLCRAMPRTAARASLAFLTPELDASQVSYGVSPVGRMRITSASIPCGIGGVTGLPELDLSVVKIRVTRLGFELGDLGTSAEKITLNATAKALTANAVDGAGLELDLSLEMSDYMAELRFIARNLKSIVDLARAISLDAAQVEKLPVPLTRRQKAGDRDAFSSLSCLSEKSSSVGFSLRSSEQQGASFELSSIFLTVRFEDWDFWTSYLPPKIKPSKIQNAVTAITVLDPASASRRRVKVEIEFQYNFDTIKMTLPGEEAEVEVKRYIDCRFVAEPMASSSDFAFQLDLSCEGGFSVGDVFRTVGLDLDTSLTTSFPPLEPMMKRIKANHVSLGVELARSEVSFTDWSIELIAEEMAILPKFYLHDLRLNIAKLVSASFACEGEAGFYLEAVDKHFQVSCRLPQAAIPGHIAVDAPRGLTLVELMKCFSDFDVSAIPIIKDIVDVQLNNFRFGFGYKMLCGGDEPRHDSTLSILTVSANLSKNKLEIPIGETKTLEFIDLEFSFTWYTANYFSPSADKAIKTFSAKVTLPSGSFAGRIAYTSANSSLFLELIPLKQSTVGDFLKSVLPDDIVDAIIPVVGGLALKQGSIFVDAIDRCIDKLCIVFEKAQSIQLSKAPDAPFSVTSVALYYSRAKPKANKQIGNATSSEAPSQHDPPKTPESAYSKRTAEDERFKFNTPESSEVIKSVAQATESGPTQSGDRDEVHPTQDTLLISSTISINGKCARLSVGYGGGGGEMSKTILFGLTEEDNGALRLENILSLFLPADSGSTSSLWDLDLLTTGGSEEALKPSPFASLAPRQSDLAAILSVFGLEDLSQIPLLEQLKDVRVLHSDCAFSKSSHSNKTEMTHFVADLSMPMLTIGSMVAEDINFSIICYRQREVESGNTKATIDFELSAKLGSAKSALKIIYKGMQNIFSGSIIPVDSSVLSVVHILGQVIPGTDSVLQSSFDGLTMKKLEMKLDRKTAKPTYFHIEFSPSSEMKLLGDTDGTMLLLRSLHLEYNAQVDSKSKALFELGAMVYIAGVGMCFSLSSSTNSDSADRYANFSITPIPGEDKDPGLKGLLTQFGLKVEEKDVEAPDGCPPFSAGLKQIKGQFVDKNRLGLKLDELSFQVEAAPSLRLVEDPPIALNKVLLNISYRRADDNKKDISASVTGDLQIAQLITLSIGFKKSKDGQEYRAEAGVIKTALFERSGGSHRLKLATIMEWLVGYTADSSIPDCVAEAEIDLNNSSIEMSFTKKKNGSTSTTLISMSVCIDTLVVQIARMRTISEDAFKDSKQSWKTIVRFSVGQLPRPPPLPMVGQMEQPFAIDSQWTSDNLSHEDVGKLETVTIFSKKKVVSPRNTSQGIAFRQGISFMLLHNGEPFLVSKATNSKDGDGESNGLETKKLDKRVNGVSITNVGLGYDAKGQKVKIKFTARATIGPLDGELINFVMAVRLPRSINGQNILLSDWSNLAIEMDLDGLSLSMTGSTLKVAGILQRVRQKGQDMVVEGFEGGISVKVKKYEFTGFGSYRGVKYAGRGEFVSLMVYAMVQGPLLKTPYVEVRGISGGFGLGSQLIIPAIDDIHNFPLLMEPSSSSDTITTFAKFQGSNGRQYMKETNGASWVAAGVLAVACETIDISAIVTFPLDPDVGQISILGTASARFPRDTDKKALASIKLNFGGTIDVQQGSIVFRGQIADKSFLLLEDCILTGGFAFGAWFGPSPQAGDWCLSIGGWHPAYIPPAHYPLPPPRMGISWSYGEHLSLSGTAYVAVTPGALMGGLAVQAAFRLGKLEASFSFRADLILNMHPLHYRATIEISANLSYEVDVGFYADKWSICFQAGLHISGPPFGGSVYFDWTVIQFSVDFGDEYAPPKSLSLEEFVGVCMKKDDNSPNADHILALEGGAVPSKTVSKEPQGPDSLWTVRGHAFVFSVTSRLPATSVILTDPSSNEPRKIKSGNKILSRPMQLPLHSDGLESTLTVNIGGHKVKDPFTFELIHESLPASLWGPFDSNTSKMLAGSSRESTVTHVTGLRIRAPGPTWSTKNPKIVPFSETANCHRIRTTFENGPKVIGSFGEKRRIDGASMDMANATSAILGRTRDKESMASRNKARAAIVNSWASFRQLSRNSASKAAAVPENASLLSIKSSVPERYAEGLEHFCHDAPGVAMG
ncbi:hypothetical protein FPANT_7253 [Fusarium pseudoanthophilum]|uniref:DUF6603 domain-containing protein n=1 Tax=Fusarium pseudoanthophilum TaxID=48495 RepID=A0A8H5P0H8_9HYPO|nr:hypothetical protein FPANT_7253 [Fusarium pseudoanthophilum]